MGLNFAIEELYATGWSGLDTTGCDFAPDGRPYPAVTRCAAEFAAAGFDLAIRYAQIFDCYRAEWQDSAGAPAGGVVGATESEAAVYALAQMRRSTARVGV